MSLQKVLKMVQAVGKEEGECHVPECRNNGQKSRGYNELSDLEGLRGNPCA